MLSHCSQFFIHKKRESWLESTDFGSVIMVKAIKDMVQISVGGLARWLFTERPIIFHSLYKFSTLIFYWSISSKTTRFLTA